VADTPIKFLPAGFARDTVEGLFAEQGGPRAWTYWLMLVGAAISLGSLPVIDVDVTVRAPGAVRPVTERVELRPAVPGHIARVLVSDNAHVVAGQPLLVLASPDLDERIARNRTVQARQAALIADLQRLTAVRTVPPGATGPTRAGDLPAPVDNFETDALRREHAQLLAQLDSNRLDETKARNEYERYATLAARGIASRRELDRARYEVERLQAEAVLIARQALARWQARLRDEEDSLAGLRSDEKRLHEEQAQFTIHAPVEGMLIGFNGWSVGGFISSGQSLGAVSPGDSLVVEALVPPRDVGLIFVGQAARLAIDAYPYTQWGTLDGTVATISADSLGGGITNAPGPVFQVTVRPAGTTLHLANGVRGELRKGLTVQARFLVGRRSLFHLLYENAAAWLDPRHAPAVRT
jgi:HlyD family secretion protein